MPRGGADAQASAPFLRFLFHRRKNPMGRYDITNDTNGTTTVALWKVNDEYPKVPLSGFTESGTDESPSLECMDDAGTKYTLFGAWPRNVQKCVRQWGANVGQWEDAVLAIGKNGRQLELVPLQPL